MLTQVRVDRLSKSDTLIVHIEDAVVILKEVDAQIGLARVSSWRDLQDAVPIPIDHVLVLGDHVGRLIDREGQVGHRIILLYCAVGAPEAYRVQLGFASTILLVHDAQQVVHSFLRQRDERSTRVWQHDSWVELKSLITELDTSPVKVPSLLRLKRIVPLDGALSVLSQIVATHHELRWQVVIETDQEGEHSLVDHALLLE